MAKTISNAMLFVRDFAIMNFFSISQNERYFFFLLCFFLSFFLPHTTTAITANGNRVRLVGSRYYCAYAKEDIDYWKWHHSEMTELLRCLASINNIFGRNE